MAAPENKLAPPGFDGARDDSNGLPLDPLSRLATFRENDSIPLHASRRKLKICRREVPLKLPDWNVTKGRGAGELELCGGNCPAGGGDIAFPCRRLVACPPPVPNRERIHARQCMRHPRDCASPASRPAAYLMGASAMAQTHRLTTASSKASPAGRRRESFTKPKIASAKATMPPKYAMPDAPASQRGARPQAPAS
jgi:hypothetical protein